MQMLSLCAYLAFPFRQNEYSASMYNSEFCGYFNASLFVENEL